jgi:hypothetical protein
MAGATIIFTLVRGILLRPFPLPGEDQLVVSWRMPPDGPTHVPYRAADVEEIGRSSRSFAAVAGVGYNGAWEYRWLDGDSALIARTAVVMGELFDVLGATPKSISFQRSRAISLLRAPVKARRRIIVIADKLDPLPSRTRSASPSFASSDIDKNLSQTRSGYSLITSTGLLEQKPRLTAKENMPPRRPTVREAVPLPP